MKMNFTFLYLALLFATTPALVANERCRSTSLSKIEPSTKTEPGEIYGEMLMRIIPAIIKQAEKKNSTYLNEWEILSHCIPWISHPHTDIGIKHQNFREIEKTINDTYGTTLSSCWLIFIKGLELKINDIRLKKYEAGSDNFAAARKFIFGKDYATDLYDQLKNHIQKATQEREKSHPDVDPEYQDTDSKILTDFKKKVTMLNGIEHLMTIAQQSKVYITSNTANKQHRQFTLYIPQTAHDWMNNNIENYNDTIAKLYTEGEPLEGVKCTTQIINPHLPK